MFTKTSAPALLPLALGGHAPTRFNGLREFAESLERAGYLVLDLAADGTARPLEVECAFVGLQSVTLLAVSSSTHRVVTQRSGRVSLCFGVDGAGMLSAGRSTAMYHRAAGVFLPECPIEWRIDSLASDFEVSLDRAMLIATARIMLGLDADAALTDLDLDDLRPVPPTAGVVLDGRTRLIELAIQADRYRHEPRVLAASGIEDQCLRQAVFLLLPQAFLKTDVSAGALLVKRTELDRLCEWLRANLHTPLTLTEIERFSSLAARTLQASFRKRFGTSPLAWLREQRLLAARTMLERPGEAPAAEAVEEAATTCGFGSTRQLRRWYAARFGETPFETVDRRR